jgi:hypothetical protein
MAGVWDMYNWYNWWLPHTTESEDEVSIEEQAPPKKKKRTTKRKIKSTPEGIQLVLLPEILEALDDEAASSDSTLNQIIENILKNYLESKGSNPSQTESWVCTFCDPEVEFFDYFKYSEHFLQEHIQSDLQKLSELNQNL